MAQKSDITLVLHTKEVHADFAENKIYADFAEIEFTLISQK